MGRSAPQRDEQAETPVSRLVALARAQLGLTTLALMAVAGLAISIYLTIVHYDSKVALVCNTGGLVNCQSVTTSAYSVVPGTSIPITIPGMLWFLALGGLAIVGLRWVARGEPEDARARPAMLLLTILGLAFVIYLVFCEIVLVQRLCEWCTVIHLLTLAAFLIALTRWQRRDEPALAPARRAGQPTPATPTTTQRHGAPPALSRRTRHAASHRSPTAR